jgi:RNA polymerase sigma-70 factor (ECF subfamily)
VTDDRRGAFERLCREEWAGLVRAAYLITGDREEAMDIAQEALARAFERWKVVSALDRPGAWLHRVAANLALSWRRRQRIRSRPQPVTAPGERESSPADLPDPGLMRALGSLPMAQRAAVVLRHLVGLSIEDTAIALSKKPGTVRALTAQGMARLRTLLSGEEMNDEVRR